MTTKLQQNFPWLHGNLGRHIDLGQADMHLLRMRQRQAEAARLQRHEREHKAMVYRDAMRHKVYHLINTCVPMLSDDEIIAYCFHELGMTLDDATYFADDTLYVCDYVDDGDENEEYDARFDDWDMSDDEIPF